MPHSQPSDTDFRIGDRVEILECSVRRHNGKKGTVYQEPEKFGLGEKWVCMVRIDMESCEIPFYSMHLKHLSQCPKCGEEGPLVDYICEVCRYGE